MQFFAKATSCGMDDDLQQFSPDSPSAAKTPCCQDKSTFHKYEPTKDQQVDQFASVVATAPFVRDVPTAFAKTSPAAAVRPGTNYYRPPPLRRAERLARLQVYTI